MGGGHRARPTQATWMSSISFGGAAEKRLGWLVVEGAGKGHVAKTTCPS